jgi:hypothetical protein
MGPETDPEGEKKKPQKDGGKGKDGGGAPKPEKSEEGPLDLSQFGFKRIAGGDEPAGSSKPIELPRSKSVPEDALVDEDTSEEKAQRAAIREEARKLGIEPWDKSKMVEGPPLSPDDIQNMHRFFRQGIDLDTRFRILDYCGRYRNWHDAFEEALFAFGRELAEGLRRQN